MRYYTFNEQHLVDGFYSRVTASEEAILAHYFSYWAGAMAKAGKEDLITQENCIEDWCVVNWAWETDKYGDKLR